jgi:hypothetical protein
MADTCQEVLKKHGVHANIRLLNDNTAPHPGSGLYSLPVASEPWHLHQCSVLWITFPSTGPSSLAPVPVGATDRCQNLVPPGAS